MTSQEFTSKKKNVSKGKAAHGLHDLSPHVDFLALYNVFSIHDFDAEASESGFFSYLKVQDFTNRVFFDYFHISTHCMADQDPLVSNSNLLFHPLSSSSTFYLIVNNIMWKLKILCISSEHNCLQPSLNPTLLQPKQSSTYDTPDDMTKSHPGFHGSSGTELGVLTAWLPWQPCAIGKETTFITDTEYVHGEL